jgi:cytochrome c oxidase assembly protein subunit 11
MDTRNQDLVRKNARTGLAILAVIAGMAALSFISVPLYKLFCAATGFGGTTAVATALPETVLDRTVTIKFTADTGRGMPWDFKPDLREVEVRLGEKGLASFTAHSRQTRETAGTAIYNVSPPKAGRYFNKIQCFCFDKQVLTPGQTVSMPVMFFIDPKMNEDPNMDDVKTITLSYTFYPADSKELEDALTGFYNDNSSGNDNTQ